MKSEKERRNGVLEYWSNGRMVECRSGVMTGRAREGFFTNTPVLRYSSTPIKDWIRPATCNEQQPTHTTKE
jgi:hypothetical protein